LPQAGIAGWWCSQARWAEKGDTRLALHLAEFALDAAPGDTSIALIRDQVLDRCIECEGSLMGKAFFAACKHDGNA
jgi:hypothetical protein